MTQHTPGPWTYREGPDWHYIVTGPDRRIVEVLGDEANARLISAAPDLYAAALDAYALIDRVGDSRKDRPVLDALWAAICKVTGEASS